MIFYGLFTVSPTYSGRKLVNRRILNWSKFNVTCMRSTQMTNDTTFKDYSGSIDSTAINLIPDLTFLIGGGKSSGDYGEFDSYVSITLSYNNGSVFITQTQYESFMNSNAGSEYDSRDASYQFNESGITYLWYALTEATT